jgi:hypothetical protein
MPQSLLRRRAASLPDHDLRDISPSHFAAVLFKQCQRHRDGSFHAGRNKPVFRLRGDHVTRVIQLVSAKPSPDPEVWAVKVRDIASGKKFSLQRPAPDPDLLCLGLHIRSLAMA